MTRPLKVVIIDDEPLAIDLLEGYIKQMPELILIDSFYNAQKALTFINQYNNDNPNAIDIILLDINMPQLDGLQLAAKVSTSAQIVFTTANAEFALQGFELNATDYLHKPFNLERFKLAIAKVRRFHQGTHQTHKITLKLDGEQQRIDCNDILYLEAARKYVAFHTQQGPLICLMSMRAATELVAGAGFVQIHKSYCVNLDYVRSYDRYEVHLKDRSLPLGDKFKKDFQARFG